MGAAWDRLTKTSRRRFWIFIFPTVAGFFAYMVAITVHMAMTLPETLQKINRIERLD